MDTSEVKRLKIIRTAGIIALLGNLVLALIKIILGLISGSLAVLGDGIDSSTDVAIAIITLIVGKVIAIPSDTDHPWGHGRAETTATMVLSFILFFAGAQLGLSAIKQLIDNSGSALPGSLALIATVISIAGKIILAWTQTSLGKKAHSAMILANAQNMKSDIVISVSVLAGLAGSQIFNLPSIDSITALAVSLWVIKNAIKIFMAINTELMDGNSQRELYTTLFTAVKDVEGVSNPHRARIRKIGSRWDIDLDIEVDASLTVHNAHIITEKAELAIRNAIPDVYDIMVHIEPAGHSKHHRTEQYGLSEQMITQ